MILHNVDKVLNCFTPGIDSFLSNYFLLKNNPALQIKNVYVDINSRYSYNEINYLSKYHDDVYVIKDQLNLSRLEDPYSSNIPNRNMLIITTVLSNNKDYNVVCLNGVKDDNVSDNTQIFYDALSEVLSISMSRDIRIISPLITKEKSVWLNKYKYYEREHKMDIHIKTFSCYYPMLSRKVHIDNNGMMEEHNTEECLCCNACFRKNCALYSIGIYIPFYNETIVEEYIDNINKYGDIRKNSIINYVQRLNA